MAGPLKLSEPPTPFDHKEGDYPSAVFGWCTVKYSAVAAQAAAPPIANGRFGLQASGKGVYYNLLGPPDNVHKPELVLSPAAPSGPLFEAVPKDRTCDGAGCPFSMRVLNEGHEMYGPRPYGPYYVQPQSGRTDSNVWTLGRVERQREMTQAGSPDEASPAAPVYGNGAYYGDGDLYFQFEYVDGAPAEPPAGGSWAGTTHAVYLQLVQHKIIDGEEKTARAYVTSVGQQEYDTLMLSFGEHPAKLAFTLTANVPV